MILALASPAVGGTPPEPDDRIGEIRGFVFDPEGKPLADVRVEASAVEPTEGRAYLLEKKGPVRGWGYEAERS